MYIFAVYSIIFPVVMIINVIGIHTYVCLYYFYLAAFVQHTCCLISFTTAFLLFYATACYKQMYVWRYQFFCLLFFDKNKKPKYLHYIFTDWKKIKTFCFYAWKCLLFNDIGLNQEYSQVILHDPIVRLQLETHF